MGREITTTSAVTNYQPDDPSIGSSNDFLLITNNRRVAFTNLNALIANKRRFFQFRKRFWGNSEKSSYFW